MMLAAKSMSTIGGEETEATPEDILSEIINWLVGDIWNAGMCDISHYFNDGKSSTEETIDVSFSISGLDEAMKRKQEYALCIKALPHTYKNVVDTWAKVSAQVDLLYGAIKASDLMPNGKGLDTGLYSQYFDAFDKAVSEMK